MVKTVMQLLPCAFGSSADGGLNTGLAGVGERSREGHELLSEMRRSGVLGVVHTYSVLAADRRERGASSTSGARTVRLDRQKSRTSDSARIRGSGTALRAAYQHKAFWIQPSFAR